MKRIIGLIVSILVLLMAVLLTQDTGQPSDVGGESPPPAAAMPKPSHLPKPLAEEALPTPLPVAQSRVTEAESIARFRFDQASAILRNDPNDPTQLLPEATELGSVSLPPEVEIDHIFSLLKTLQVIANGGDFPTGFNYEFTNALLGDNPKKVAFISASNSRIDQNGELVDIWGTPYLFHVESTTNVTIHSAGPDRKLFTDDDLTSHGERY